MESEHVKLHTFRVYRMTADTAGHRQRHLRDRLLPKALTALLATALGAATPLMPRPMPALGAVGVLSGLIGIVREVNLT